MLLCQNADDILDKKIGTMVSAGTARPTRNSRTTLHLERETSATQTCLLELLDSTLINTAAFIDQVA